MYLYTHLYGNRVCTYVIQYFFGIIVIFIDNSKWSIWFIILLKQDTNQWNVSHKKKEYIVGVNLVLWYILCILYMHDMYVGAYDYLHTYIVQCVHIHFYLLYII